MQVFTAESIWKAEAVRAEGALAALEEARAELKGHRDKVRPGCWRLSPPVLVYNPCRRTAEKAMAVACLRIM